MSRDWLVRLLAPADKCPPLRDLPTNPQQAAPRRDPSKTSSDASSRLGRTWLKDTPSTPPSFSSAFPTQSPRLLHAVSVLSPSVASKPATSPSTVGSTFTAAASRPTPAPRTSPTVATTLQSKSNNEKETTTAAGVGGGSAMVSAGTIESSKAKAAAFISRKLVEENNNKPSWTNVKKTDK